MKKRILAMICSVTLCFMLLAPVMVNAQEEKIIGSAGDECYFVFYPASGLMKILPCSYAQGDVEVWHYMGWDIPVQQVKKVVIADGITGIQGNVFLGWENLESVEMPDSVTTISYGAFASCNSLKGGLVIPKNVTSIREYAFADCASLDELTFDGSAPEYFDEEAFVNVTADVYYDATDSSWDNMKANYGGSLTWVDKAEQNSGAWVQNNIGWWWQYADGSYPANEWKLINNEWYFFEASGYMKTGWLNQGGTWYYLAPSGAMVTNQWIGAYYLGADGVMATNQWIGNYYVDASGAYVATTGWFYLDGNYYYLIGGAKVSNQWIGAYYLGADGVMATNQWIGNYYVDASGAYVATTGWFYLDGNYYYLIGGATQKGWLASGNTWYYLDSQTGVMYADEWLNDTYYLHANGAMATGWAKMSNGDYYYFDASGAKVMNSWIGDYYVGEDGVMATSQWIGEYYVGEDGKWIPGYVEPDPTLKDTPVITDKPGWGGLF